MHVCKLEENVLDLIDKPPARGGVSEIHITACKNNAPVIFKYYISRNGCLTETTEKVLKL